MLVENLVDGQRHLGADTCRSLQVGIARFLEQFFDVAIGEARTLDNLRRSGKTRHTLVDFLLVTIVEVQVHGADQHGEHRTLPVAYPEVETWENLTDEAVGCLQRIGIGIPLLQDFLSEGSRKYHAYVLVVTAVVAVSLTYDIVLRGEYLGGNGTSTFLDVLAQVDVRMVRLALLHDDLIAQFIHLKFHGVVGIPVVVLDVDAQFARVTLGHSVFDVCGVARFRVERNVSHHEVLVRQLVVLQTVELCGAVRFDS